MPRVALHRRRRARRRATRTSSRHGSASARATCAACSTSTSARRRTKSPASRRAHFARRLLDDTDLPIAEVGYAAGFNSVRQMNRVMKDVFHFTPQRAARRGDASADRLVTDGGLELRVPYRPPLAWDSLLAFLAPRAIPGVEAVDLDDGVYRRTVELGGAPGVIEVWNEPDHDSARACASISPSSTGSCTSLRACAGCSTSTPTRRPSTSSLARDRTLRPLVRASARHARSRRDRSVRGRRARRARPAGLGRRRNHACRPAGRSARRAGRRASRPLGLTHLFPSCSTLAQRRSRRRSGCRRPEPGRSARSRARSRRATSSSNRARDLDDTVAGAGRPARIRRLDRAVRRDAGVRRARRIPRRRSRAPQGTRAPDREGRRRPRRGVAAVARVRGDALGRRSRLNRHARTPPAAVPPAASGLRSAAHPICPGQRPIFQLEIRLGIRYDRGPALARDDSAASPQVFPSRHQSSSGTSLAVKRWPRR